jgi:hypothetical protein
MAPKAKKAIRLPTTKPGPSPLTSSDISVPPCCCKQNAASRFGVPLTVRGEFVNFFARRKDRCEGFLHSRTYFVGGSNSIRNWRNLSALRVTVTRRCRVKRNAESADR